MLFTALDKLSVRRDGRRTTREQGKYDSLHSASPESLKVDTAAQLNVPRLCAFGQAAHVSRTRGGYVGTREREIGVIEGVGERGREREFKSFRNGEGLGDRGVLHVISRTFEKIYAGISVPSRGRHGEARRIKPAIDAPLIA